MDMPDMARPVPCQPSHEQPISSTASDLPRKWPAHDMAGPAHGQSMFNQWLEQLMTSPANGLNRPAHVHWSPSHAQPKPNPAQPMPRKP